MGDRAPSSASYRFLQRVWRNVIDEETGAARVVDEAGRRRDRAGCCTARSPGSAADMEGLRFNTAIAKLIELNNQPPSVAGTAPREVAEPLVLMLAPLAPARRRGAVVAARALTVAGLRAVPGGRPGAARGGPASSIPVQVNGKVRAHVVVPSDADADAVEAAALADARVAALLDGAAPKRVVVVPQRLVNIVV